MFAHAARLAAPLLLLLAAGLTGAPRARAEETDCLAHDPSTILKRERTYWVFGTGRGVSTFSSSDRLHWKFQGPILTAAPAWFADAVPGNTNNFLWAPDIRRIGNRYCLYYSVSTFGRNVSAIGLATNPTLGPSGWTDQGAVIRSSATDDYNAIDPCVAEDAQGGLWLTFGSFWSGIRMIRLDPATGKQSSLDRTIYRLAAHPQDPAGSIEASCLTHHGGWYYLFVNWDTCCRGARSTYNIRVGRAKAVTGPYLDKDGKDMKDGGGTLFLGITAPDGARADTAAEIGPGHAGILTDNDGEWFSCHYEWARDHNGAPTLNLRKLVWTADGWPSLVPEMAAQPK